MRLFLVISITIFACLNSSQATYCLDDSTNTPDKSNQAALLNNKGLQLKKEGSLQESRQALQEACLLDPNTNSAIVHENLALTLIQLNEFNSACTELSKSLQFDPDRPSALYNLGSCYSHLGQIAQSISILKDYLEKYPDSEYADNAKRLLVSLEKTPALKDDPSGSDYSASILNSANKFSRWSLNKLPIRVYIEPGKKVNGYQPEFEDDLMSAFDQWTSIMPSRLSWLLTKKKGKADIICRWTDSRKKLQDPKGAELGETRLKYLLNPRYSDCEISKATITLCTMNFDDTKVLSNEQMKNVCLHEVGHALGIQGHSSNCNDVMFLMAKDDSVIQLTRRDKNTLARLYSSAALYQTAYPNNYSNNYSNNYQNYSASNRIAYPYTSNQPNNYQNYPNTYQVASPNNPTAYRNTNPNYSNPYQPTYSQAYQNNYSNPTGTGTYQNAQNQNINQYQNPYQYQYRLPNPNNPYSSGSNTNQSGAAGPF